MKGISVVCSCLALVAVSTIFTMCSTKKNDPGNAGGNNGGPGKVAFVNTDTFQEHFTYLKVQRDSLLRLESSMKEELGKTEQILNQQYVEMQKLAQAGQMAQAQALNQRFLQGQETYRAREQSLTEQLLKRRDDMNLRMRKMLDSFLSDYNKDKHYDYIFSKTEGSHIMYANPALDITNDVIEGMNKWAKVPADTAKKK